MEKTLPATAIITDTDKKIRLLDRYLKQRTDLVSHQTALKNQLHGLLHEYYGDDYKQSFANIFTQTAIAWYQKELSQTVAAVATDFLAADILRCLELLVVYQKQIKAVTKLIKSLSQNLPEIKKLRTIRGCGEIIASLILAEIGNIKRFATESKLARYAGIAPVTWESAGKGHLHTDSRGNRRLNYAIHRLALSQIGRNGLVTAKQFHQRKQQEKHSKLWSLRCLKRHLIRRVYAVLTEE